MKPRGLSLLEAIVAIFILTGGSLACFTLLIQAFRYQTRSQQVSDATIAGEQTMESLRRWVQTPANFDTSLDVYNDQDFPSINPPGFTCHAWVSDSKQSDPLLEGCFRLVTLEVRGGGRPLTRLTGLIASPLREPDSLKVYPETPLQLAPDQQSQFYAYLLDVDSKPIPGVRFDWSIQSEGPPDIPGRATVEPIESNRAVLTHVVYGPTPPDPNRIFVPGKLRVRATCRYRAQFFEGESVVLEMKAP
ncbi:MAG: hypothetical protein KF760_19535 [Candidatus Eremiobacteraeota bacterium]|nr:hypothetical protein [Candidatus Eremiobacteraeota bacterium]MCW5868764.1 hypothetical protein [Candidatus Eremiobacteraeota bacterium]